MAQLSAPQIGTTMDGQTSHWDPLTEPCGGTSICRAQGSKCSCFPGRWPETEAELFGLGGGTVSHAHVHWPSGLTETFPAAEFGLAPGSSNTLKEGTSPCPVAIIQYVICSTSVPINLDVDTPSPFESVWTSESGQTVNVSATHPWQPNHGDLTMTAYWEGLPMCSVTHNAAVTPLLRDFNVDGVLGNADVLALLSYLGCTDPCFTDLDNNGFVGSSNLLLMLTLIGTSCE